MDRLTSAESVALAVSAAIRDGRVPLLAPHPAEQDRGDRRDEQRVAREPHDPAGELLVGEGRRAPREIQAGVVRIERRGGIQNDDGEERVLGHLEENVGDTGRVAESPRRGIEPDRRPPEQERAAEEQPMLDVVDQRVLERRVEQRREVARPHDRGEYHSRDDRERKPANHT